MKSERGSVTLFVLIACMFFLGTLLAVNISIINKNINQEKAIQMIQENYSVEAGDMQNAYDNYMNNNNDENMDDEEDEEFEDFEENEKYG